MLRAGGPLDKLTLYEMCEFSARVIGQAMSDRVDCIGIAAAALKT